MLHVCSHLAFVFATILFDICRIVPSLDVIGIVGNNGTQMHHKSKCKRKCWTLKHFYFNIKKTILNPVIFTVNIGQTTFEAVAQIVRRVSSLVDEQNDQHNRNELLTSYIEYQCTLPHPDPGPLCKYTAHL